MCLDNNNLVRKIKEIQNNGTGIAKVYKPEFKVKRLREYVYIPKADKYFQVGVMNMSRNTKSSFNISQGMSNLSHFKPIKLYLVFLIQYFE